MLGEKNGEQKFISWCCMSRVSLFCYLSYEKRLVLNKGKEIQHKGEDGSLACPPVFRNM